ncbi:hypothetical protein [Bifidobacterium sp. ESL0790]|uniref:hypothetical protein n=1 Tax=Bifidobacterium sp. ESL0790 TaxID=2983233 RepID=UPI0023FA09E0|nr:hypothetical protein [Bifidobacterium sp. ESL0790]WEV72843.1 hypothetical protein OZY47_02425 [Bifidobacterium sp. ESL0790]
MADDKGEDSKGQDFGEGDHDGESDDLHFSDAELEAAMAGFEKEFADQDAGGDAGTDAGAQADNSGDAGSADDGDDDAGDDSNDGSDDDAQTVTGAAEETLNFDDELQGLLGNRAKVAVLVTRLSSADLLAAFCQIADISAECLADESGAVAVLRNLDGDAPEAAAKDLTRVVNGMPVVLVVNRADKLEATLYLGGEPGQKFAPPALLDSSPAFVEDLMLGMMDVMGLKAQGEHVIDTGEFNRVKAMKIIADHVKFGRRGPQIQ